MARKQVKRFEVSHVHVGSVAEAWQVAGSYFPGDTGRWRKMFNGFIRFLSVGRRALRRYRDAVIGMTSEALRDHAAALMNDYRNAEEAARAKKGLLRVPPYWMIEWADVARAELLRRGEVA